MQALIGLTIFSKGTFDDKISTLYTAFDIDGSGSIDRKELSGFLSASIISMCKIVGLPQPSRIKIQEYTYEAFKIVDTDGNGEIDPEEFSSWINCSESI
jgi:Ca2+-binding EF-hand superfamily protein